MPMQGNLGIERMCQLVAVSRAGFYRSLQEREPAVRLPQNLYELLNSGVRGRHPAPSRAR